MTLRPWAPVAAALGLSLAAGCGRHQSNAEAGIATQTLYVGNAAEPADLDPDVCYAFTDANILYALFEPLTMVDEASARPVPAAARSWDISPDGRVYTFHLVPGAVWSDGVPVTADDFAFGMERELTPAFAAAYSYMLWPIKNAEAYNEGKLKDFSQVGIRVVDPLTLRITLDEPTPYLLGMAAHNTWMPIPRHVVERFGRMQDKGTRWTRAGNLVGNGPFVLKEWTPNSRVVVDRNPRYWDAAHVRLHRIVFYPIENDDSEELAFRAGQLALTYFVPVSRLDWYRQHAPDELHIENLFASYYLFINVRRPPLNNAKLRRALSVGLDREAIARDVLRGASAPGDTFTPPDMMGYTCRAKVPSDFDLARKLLAEAGYPHGRGLPTIEVLSYDSRGSIQALAAIQSQWARQLGVHISILPQEQKTLFQNQQSGNYSIAYSAWVADYADPFTFLGMMVTGGGNNWAFWGDPEYDRLIDASTRTGDNAVRYPLFQRAEKILLEQAPVVPLLYGQHPYLKQPFVHGYPDSRLGFHRWKNVWLGR